MSTFRVIINEITPRPQGEETTANQTLAPKIETQIFSQTVEDLNVRNFVRAINATPRRSGRKAAKPQV